MKHLLLLFSLCLPLIGFAQPSNDNCANAIELQAGSQICSSPNAYNNNAATPSGFGSPSCWGNPSNDVWFYFTASATDINITVIGDQPPFPGGSLQDPQVALYIGDCSGMISQLGCGNSPVGQNIASLYEGGLIIGQTYLIRVQGANGATGSFRICLDNYNAPASPGSDCATAAVLCDKSPFNVQSVTSAGNDRNEAAGSCLEVGGSSSESNSTWFKWTCDQAGTLSFTLTPNNVPDDLDFVVYELNSLDDCSGKQLLRCMAAGDFNYPSPCMGPTGLRSSSSDFTESSGCGNGKDNFVAEINMVSGRSYALLVNNFSSSGNGFGVQFGGSGTFRGPRANFTLSPARFCAGESSTLADASTFSFGTITNWAWNFGVGSNPSRSNLQNPPAVTYNSPGARNVSLTIQTDRGCVVTEIKTLRADSCCQTLNAIGYTEQVSDVLCRNSNTGSVLISNPSSRLPLTYSWSNGSSSPNNSNLNAGLYFLTVSNGICNRRDTFSIGQPPAWLLMDTIQKPTCAGGRDGGVTITSVSGSNGGPYQYNWNGTGFGNSPFLNNLANGNYPLTVRDQLGCDTSVQFQVRELVLELDSLLAVISNPSCFGYSDGYIDAVVSNGLSPYSYQWASGQTSRAISGLTQGNYSLTQIRDANGCLGGPFGFSLTEPSLLTLQVDAQPVSCYGDRDGSAIAIANGGTLPYSYLWNNLIRDSAQLNLPPNLYTVLVTDANGCIVSDSGRVWEPPRLLIEDINASQPSCYGYLDGSISIVASGGRGAYGYALDQTFRFVPNSVFIGRGAGDYTAYVRDSAGCVVSEQFSVGQPEPIWVEIGADRTLELGDSFGIVPTFSYIDFYQYQWSHSQNALVNCDSCRDLSAYPYESGSFYLRIQSPEGCVAEDSMQVTIEKNYSVFIPNAFTPNGDGINDIFKVFGNQSVRKVVQMNVFDRWGELVYRGENIPIGWTNTGWDGTFRGQKMEAGVFMYYAEIEYLDGKREIFKGDLSLLLPPSW